MRVTSNTLREAFLSAMQDAQRRLERTHMQVSTGKKVSRPSDDPLAAARVGALEASIAQLEQYRRNDVAARNRLGLEEEALAGIVNGLQRVRELAVQANNATAGAASRAAIAAELRQQLTHLVSLANAVDAQGRYLFSGFSENVRPFVQTGTAVEYRGDDGQRAVAVSGHRLIPVGDPGSDVFERIPSGNGRFRLEADPGNTGTGVLGAASVTDPSAFVSDSYDIAFLSSSDYEVRDGGGTLIASGTYSGLQPIAFLGIEIELTGEPAAGDVFRVEPGLNRSLFSTVQDLVAALESPVGSSAARALYHNRIGQGLVDLDAAIDHLLQVRAEVGARLQALDAEAALNDGFTVQLEAAMSSLQDLDYAEAISRLNQQLLGLEASQQTFARLQNLSLFRFL